jgi:hypothetical protein
MLLNIVFCTHRCSRLADSLLLYSAAGVAEAGDYWMSGERPTDSVQTWLGPSNKPNEFGFYRGDMARPLGFDAIRGLPLLGVSRVFSDADLTTRRP